MSKKEVVFMNLVANNQNMVEIQEAIKFDDITSSSEGIMYDEMTNSILFTEDGVFFISWWVSIMDIGMRGGFSTLIKNDKNEILASGDIKISPTTEIGELTLSGNGIIKISKGEKIRLINNSRESIRLTRENGFSGQMTINEISDSGVYAAVRNGGNIDMVEQGTLINMDTIDVISNIMYKDGLFTIIESGQYFIAWKGNMETLVVFEGNLQFAMAILRNGVQLISSVTKGGVGLEIQLSEGVGVVALEMGDVIGLYNISDTNIGFASLDRGVPVNIGIYKI